MVSMVSLWPLFSSLICLFHKIKWQSFLSFISLKQDVLQKTLGGLSLQAAIHLGNILHRSTLGLKPLNILTFCSNHFMVTLTMLSQNSHRFNELRGPWYKILTMQSYSVILVCLLKSMEDFSASLCDHGSSRPIRSQSSTAHSSIFNNDNISCLFNFGIP